MFKIIMTLTSFFYLTEVQSNGNADASSFMEKSLCNFSLRGEVLHGDKYCIYGFKDKSIVIRQTDSLHCLPCVSAELKAPNRIIIIPG